MDFMQHGIGGLAVFMFLIGIVTSILWLVIGWRAMRAHEKIADYIELMARRQLDQRETQSNVSTDD